MARFAQRRRVRAERQSGRAKEFMRPSRHWYQGLGLTAVLAGLITLLPQMASAQMMAGPGPDMMEGGPMGGPDLPMFLRSADLRPDQRAQAQRILDHNHPAFANLFDQIHATKQQLDDQLFTAGPLNTAGVEKCSKQIAQLQAQLADLELQTALQIRALLTPGQLNRVAEFHGKLERLHQQMHDLMQENMPPPGPPGPPPGPPPPFPGE
jgi:Spy/CpxP family protein refolding chaperone